MACLRQCRAASSAAPTLAPAANGRRPPSTTHQLLPLQQNVTRRSLRYFPGLRVVGRARKHTDAAATRSPWGWPRMALTSGVLFGSADILCHQRRAPPADDDGGGSWWPTGLDAWRAACFFIVGTCLFFPCQHLCAAHLERRFPGSSSIGAAAAALSPRLPWLLVADNGRTPAPSKNLLLLLSSFPQQLLTLRTCVTATVTAADTRRVRYSQVVRKLALDSFVMAPCTTGLCVVALMSLEQGSFAVPALPAGKDILLTNWAVWIPAHLISFGLVPVTAQALFMSATSCVWACCLSWWMDGRLGISQAAVTAATRSPQTAAPRRA
jgi:hypothetical protein